MSVIFRDDQLFSPCHIWLRDEGELTDAELLETFGLLDYQPLPFSPLMKGWWTHAVIVDGGEWTLLADDLRYTLWSLRTTRPTIERLASQFDIFACSVGDTDHSFDFIYYRAGQLVRHYAVIDSHYTGGEVAINVGAPLRGEKRALARKDEVTKVMAVASGLGLQTTFTEHELLVYVPQDDLMHRLSQVSI